jgi:hypothetical protein
MVHCSGSGLIIGDEVCFIADDRDSEGHLAPVRRGPDLADVIALDRRRVASWAGH